jgi:hypothetical protein
MKKLILIAMTFFLLMSFDSKKEVLQFNLEKGKVYHMFVEASTDIEQTVEGNKMNINMKYTTQTDYTIKEIRDTFYEIDIQYKIMTLKMNMNGENVNMDSESADSANPLNKMARRMVNSPSFHIKMSKSGNVFEVRGLDQMLDYVFDKESGIQKEVVEAMQPSLKNAFGEQAFKEGLKNSFIVYPKIAISKGDKWKTNGKMVTSMEADINNEFELNSVSPNELGIKGVSQIKSNPKTYKPINELYAFYDLKGEMTSDLKIDRNTAWINTGTIKQNFKGVMTLKQSVTDQSGYDVPLSFKIVVNLKSTK